MGLKLLLTVTGFVWTIGTGQNEWGLSGRRQNADIADALHLRDVAMATIFGFLYMGCTMAVSYTHLTLPTIYSV